MERRYSCPPERPGISVSECDRCTLWKTRSVRKYVIMGVQGSGKGTQAGLLAADLDIVHVSVGDTLRWHVQQHTKIGAQVRRAMATGQLVADDLVESVVRDRLAIHDLNYDVTLDAYTRTPPQADFFPVSPHSA